MKCSYLLGVNLDTIPETKAETLVVGSGIAGLSAAIAASRSSKVLVVTKLLEYDTNTQRAQGGIAACIDPGDTPAAYVEDTMKAGAGLCNRAAVEKMVSESEPAVKELMGFGTKFDADGDRLRFTLEGGHSVRRVLHAGDFTGEEIMRGLLGKARDSKRIKIRKNAFLVDLLCHKGRCFGALVLDRSKNSLAKIISGATVLASGGLGQVYRETTNPEIATGDGFAAACRAGAGMADMEFVQFHPTTLYLAGAPRFLISESLRGEGASLVNTRREHFMEKYHRAKELAPRDVVSRAIMEEIARTKSAHVYLDVRRLGAKTVQNRFPNITKVCATYGLDITKNLIPVRPSAHYMMGGVQSGLDTSTSIERLFAAGEVACTGVHGANRLASNSLLEGLVFGFEAGRRAAGCGSGTIRKFPLKKLGGLQVQESAPLNIADLVVSLKSTMWRNTGIYRNADALQSTLRAIDFWSRYSLRGDFRDVRMLEFQNMLMTAHLIAKAAELRKESRGGHFRTDFPETNDESWRRHIVLRRIEGEDKLRFDPVNGTD